MIAVYCCSGVHRVQSAPGHGVALTADVGGHRAIEMLVREVAGAVLDVVANRAPNQHDGVAGTKIGAQNRQRDRRTYRAATRAARYRVVVAPACSLDAHDRRSGVRNVCRV